MTPPAVFRRGSRAAVARAHRLREWAAQSARSSLRERDHTRFRKTRTRTIPEFLCRGCGRWTVWEHGAHDGDGALAICNYLCDTCANAYRRKHKEAKRG